jgi:radical SAM superfamily enzyme YgiQ (UPF0313 family)
MNRVLLLNPSFPRSFWALDFIVGLCGAKSHMPPLGLLTVAALLPPAWQLRLIDLNVGSLSEDDWQWADLVMVTGMATQRQGIIELCQDAAKRGKTVVAGGPYATAWPQKVLEAGCNFVFLGEAEETIHDLIMALGEKKTRGIFPCETKPKLSISPIPRYDLASSVTWSTCSDEESDTRVPNKLWRNWRRSISSDGVETFSSAMTILSPAVPVRERF